MPIKLKNDPKQCKYKVLSDLSPGDTFKFNNTQCVTLTIVYMVLDPYRVLNGDDYGVNGFPLWYSPMNSNGNSGQIYSTARCEASKRKITKVQIIAEMKEC